MGGSRVCPCRIGFLVPKGSGEQGESSSNVKTRKYWGWRGGKKIDIKRISLET